MKTSELLKDMADYFALMENESGQIIIQGDALRHVAETLRMCQQAVERMEGSEAQRMAAMAEKLRRARRAGERRADPRGAGGWRLGQPGRPGGNSDGDVA
jgi:hypothetical protein